MERRWERGIRIKSDSCSGLIDEALINHLVVQAPQNQNHSVCLDSFSPFTVSTRGERLEQDRANHQQIRVYETPLQRRARLEQDCAQRQQRRAQETSAERAARLEQDRVRRQKLRLQ